MKKGIHPENYRLVAFKDMSNDHVFLCRSAVSTKETIEVNGETYPVYKMEISNTGIGSIRKMVHDQSSGPARNRTKELLRKKFGGLRHKHYFCNLLKLLFLWNSKVSYIKSCP